MEERRIVPGLYERLLDEGLATLLAENPSFIPALEKLDEECEVQVYSLFVAQLLQEALPIAGHKHRLELVNRLIEVLAAQDGLDYTLRRRLLAEPKTLLRQIRQADDEHPFPEPETPLNISTVWIQAGRTLKSLENEDGWRLARLWENPEMCSSEHLTTGKYAP